MFILNGQKISNDFRINSQNAVGSEFDLKTTFYGIKHINGEKPKNYPDNFLPWGICISIETVVSARVQIAIDTTIQFLISTLNSDVKIQKRKLSPTGFSSNSEWQKL